MINPKELLEDFLALGYDDDTAIKLTKKEFKRKQADIRKSNIEAAKKRGKAPRTHGFYHKPGLC